MDISSIIGVVSGMGFVLGTILLGGSIMMFVNIPSILVVMGGTIAATMVGYPLSDFLGMFKTGIKVFMFKIEKPEDIIANLVEISNKARKGGLLEAEAGLDRSPSESKLHRKRENIRLPSARKQIRSYRLCQVVGCHGHRAKQAYAG